MEKYETVTLSEQENVLDAVYRDRPDAILLDVHLTQGNGVDLLREIRSDPSLHNIFVIMQSGMNLANECKEAGADTFLLKPYMPDTLIEAIKTGLASRNS
jgi:CheY-like chemotaxis protein